MGKNTRVVTLNISLAARSLVCWFWSCGTVGVQCHPRATAGQDTLSLHRANMPVTGILGTLELIQHPCHEADWQAHLCYMFRCFPAHLGSSETRQQTQTLGIPFCAVSAVKPARKAAGGVVQIPLQILCEQEYKLLTRAACKHRPVTTAACELLR